MATSTELRLIDKILDSGLANDRQNTFELYLHLIPHQLTKRKPTTEQEPVDETNLMTQNEAIVHILKCCEVAKAFLHWQVTARCSLLSLWLDRRISESVKKTIEEHIADATLPNYDHLLRQMI